MCVCVCVCPVLSRNVFKDYLKQVKNIMEQNGRVIITKITGPLPYFPIMLPCMSLNICQLEADNILKVCIYAQIYMDPILP